MTFTLKQLETFVWLAVLGNYHKTAKKLYTTQPAISNRIVSLETGLGFKLFERDTGSVYLTSKGQELLPYAEKILNMANQLQKRTDGTDKMSRLLRLGVSETVVHTWLPKFLTKLHSKYPNLDIEITVDITTNLRRELISRALDLAFLMGPISEFRMDNIKLPKFDLIWVTSPKLKIALDKAFKISDIKQYPVLTYARNTRPYIEIENHLKNKRRKPVRIFPSSSLAACIRMTIDGVGIGCLPKLVIAKELMDGSLVEVPLKWKPSALNFTATFSNQPDNIVAETAASLAKSVAINFTK